MGVPPLFSDPSTVSQFYCCEQNYWLLHYFPASNGQHPHFIHHNHNGHAMAHCTPCMPPRINWGQYKPYCCQSSVDMSQAWSSRQCLQTSVDVYSTNTTIVSLTISIYTSMDDKLRSNQLVMPVDVPVLYRVSNYKTSVVFTVCMYPP